MPKKGQYKTNAKPRAVAQRKYKSKPSQKKNTASRNAARAIMKKAGRKIAGKDVHHKNKNPRDNRLCNLATKSEHSNRADNKKRGK